MTRTALVLAGVRPGRDPLAEFAGVSHKALIPIGGTPMLERVIAALRASGRIDRIAVSIDRPELVTLPGVEVLRSSTSVSRSVGEALEALGGPLLVTTADHALLEPDWVRYFLDHLPDVDVVAGLARDRDVMAAAPDTKRTFLRFRDGRFSGCNLFHLRDLKALRAIQLWQIVENERKKPLTLLRRLGLRAVFAHLAGRLTLAYAVRRIEEMAGCTAGIVELPFGRAAIDVDKPDDLILVRRIVEQDAARA
ncbi:NTP transferase domain-containing protein [Methylopila henanensis]|uniref:NTP transferase domain-containing protein n=1 Tax=Methylopila henanensis TaxID=873516 RepID=A0ABW4K483_9HYPH